MTLARPRALKDRLRDARSRAIRPDWTNSPGPIAARPIPDSAARRKTGWKTGRSRLGWHRWEAGPRMLAAPFEPYRRKQRPISLPKDPGSAGIHCNRSGIMRPGQNKRSRGRSGGGGGGSGGGGGNPHHNNNRPRPPHRQQTFDSNGPNVKIRGNAYQVFERYIALAREAQTGGDRVTAENLYQHAEHYFRIMNAQGEGQGGAPPAADDPGRIGYGDDGRRRRKCRDRGHAGAGPASAALVFRAAGRRAVAVLLDRASPRARPARGSRGRPLSRRRAPPPVGGGHREPPSRTLNKSLAHGFRASRPAGHGRRTVRARRTARHAASRSRISISTSCGPRTKAMRTPGRMVFGSTVNSTPLVFNSSQTASMLRTRSPRWSSPT